MHSIKLGVHNLNVHKLLPPARPLHLYVQSTLRNITVIDALKDFAMESASDSDVKLSTGVL